MKKIMKENVLFLEKKKKEYLYSHLRSVTDQYLGNKWKNKENNLQVQRSGVRADTEDIS